MEKAGRLGEEWVSGAGGLVSGPSGCIPSLETKVQGNMAVWKTSSSTAPALLLDKGGCIIGVVRGQRPVTAQLPFYVLLLFEQLGPPSQLGLLCVGL